MGDTETAPTTGWGCEEGGKLGGAEGPEIKDTEDRTRGQSSCSGNCGARWGFDREEGVGALCLNGPVESQPVSRVSSRVLRRRPFNGGVPEFRPLHWLSRVSREKSRIFILPRRTL